MTSAGFDALRGELDRLRSDDREEVRQRLSDARSYGAESDEVYALREEEAILEARIAMLEDTLSRAAVVSPDQAPDWCVAVGSVVALEDAASGATSRYRIAGAHETFVPGQISVASPMGQALIGAAPGADVQATLPDGCRREVRVISVDPPRAGETETVERQVAAL
jgi:transcription elongation factor GreA